MLVTSRASSRLGTWISALCFLGLPLAAGPIVATWNTPTTIDTAITAAHYSLAVNAAANTVDLVYTKGGNVYFNSVLRPTGTLGTAVSVFTGAAKPSIAVDSAGGLHVAAFNTAAQTLMYGYSNNGGSSWTTMTLDNSAANRGDGTSITIDAGNRVHIAYRGQNGTVAGGGPRYDLFYERFNGDATGGGTVTAGNWDAPLLVQRADRIGTTATWVSLGADVTNYGIESNASTVWFWRREGDTGDANWNGFIAKRGVADVAAPTITMTDSQWGCSYFGQIALDNSGNVWRAWNDRNQAVNPALTGFRISQLNAAGTAVASQQAIDVGTHGLGWFNVGKHADISIDADGYLHTVYYNNMASGLKYAWSTGGGTWSTLAIPSAGMSYSLDNRIAFDSVVGGGIGELYVLSADTSNNLRLFSVSLLPEPGTLTLVALATSLALCRRRR